ncbi:Uncharacterised protein [Vibrio cholerae]|uniref:Uncharacterized protein n=1 Tax=Vibrio cholerae TaxID=666 RepID=A0A655P5U9_VIBCL|nr:Uncharacterised protein [Vibrio cholerae]
MRLNRAVALKMNSSLMKVVSKLKWWPIIGADSSTLCPLPSRAKCAAYGLHPLHCWLRLPVIFLGRQSN